MRCPRAPESEYYDQFPLTVNDRDTHDRVRTPFGAFFEDGVVGDGDPVTASEDFSRIPGAWDASYLYWNVTGTVDPSTSTHALRCLNRAVTPQAWDRTPPIRRRIELSCLLRQ